MANAAIVVLRKHGNVLIGEKQIAIKILVDRGTNTTDVLGSAKLGSMKLGG